MISNGTLRVVRETTTSSTAVRGNRDLESAHRRVLEQDQLRNRAQEDVVHVIEDVCTRMDLTGGTLRVATETCAQFFAMRMALAKKRLNRPKEAIALACVKSACDELGWPRTLREFYSPHVSSCDAQSIRGAITELSKLVKRSKKVPRPGDFVPRFCTYLRLQYAVERKASELLKAAPRELLDHRIPQSMAAASIARVAEVPARQVAEGTGVAESTITHVLKEWQHIEQTAKDNAQAEAEAEASEVWVEELAAVSSDAWGGDADSDGMVARVDVYPAEMPQEEEERRDVPAGGDWWSGVEAPLTLLRSRSSGLSFAASERDLGDLGW